MEAQLKFGFGFFPAFAHHKHLLGRRIMLWNAQSRFPLGSYRAIRQFRAL
ncbi:hypothetical protein [Arthrobacter sp. LFS091]